MTSSEWPQDILNIPQATAAALDFRPENVLHGEAWISHPLQKLFSLDVPYNTGPVPQKIDTTEGKSENDFHLGDTTHTETTQKKISKSKSSGCLFGFLSLLQDFLPPFLLLQPLTFLVLAVEGLRPSPKQLPQSHQLIPHRVQLKSADLFVTKVFGHTFLLVLRVFEEMMSSCEKNNFVETVLLQ